MKVRDFIDAVDDFFADREEMMTENADKTPDFLSFGNAFPDGRLCEPGDNFPDFSMKAVCAEVLRLGRPLTNEEFKKFINEEK